MEELKEKIAKILIMQEFCCDWEMVEREWDRVDELDRQECFRSVQRILTLFRNWLKEQLEGLEVIGEDKQGLDWTDSGGNQANWIMISESEVFGILQAQLQDVKDKLLGRVK